LTEDDKDGKDTDQNISARSLTLLCGGVGIVGWCYCCHFLC